MMSTGRSVWVSLILAAAALSGGAPSARAADATYAVRKLPLPGGGGGLILMDYIAFDSGTHSVWAPAGNTGAVDVVDSSTGTIRQVSGFPTAEMGTGERKRIVGPSSVTIGKTSVYVGNRGDSSVCA